MTYTAEAAFELEEIRRSFLARALDAERLASPIEGQTLPSDVEAEVRREITRAQVLVDDLDSQLSDNEWQPPAESSIPHSEHHPEYGFVLLQAPLREIIRGYLKPVRRVPLVARMPERVWLYLITMLPGVRDGLARDIHGGIGYHYHYLDRLKRRSDVVLSFDTRWVAPTKPLNSQLLLRPLFVEKHAEGKAHFVAKPWSWQNEKRQSIYDICARDLHFGVQNFRCAANGSDAVWPRSATLTPRPSTVAVSSRANSASQPRKARP
jgi:hypothetical protein